MAHTTSLTVPPPPEPEYPESDGKPIGETEYHVDAIAALRDMLKRFFASAEDVYVGACIMFYYRQGDPTAVSSPDVFVVRGIGKHKRRVYKVWEERADGRPAAPCTVFEITSPDTLDEDRGAKHKLYERLGVQEYFLFDPIGECLSPRLQGFALVRGRYRAMPLATDGTLASAALELTLRRGGDLLRITDTSTGRRVLTYQELAEAVEAMTRRRAEAEARRAETQATRAQNARLRAELDRSRKR